MVGVYTLAGYIFLWAVTVSIYIHTRHIYKNGQQEYNAT